MESFLLFLQVCLFSVSEVLLSRQLKEAERSLTTSVSSVSASLFFKKHFLSEPFPPPSQLHTDIFDLVSGIQKEAIKEERLEKERRRELKEKKRVKEKQKERVWEKEVNREKEKDDEEVLCSEELSDFEFHPNMFGKKAITKYRVRVEDLLLN